ncbi:MAG: hypothetical protein UMV23_01080 [Halanaerobium sp.]|nr:hypothetical protein [Halanaerobium sp.]
MRRNKTVVILLMVMLLTAVLVVPAMAAVLQSKYVMIEEEEWEKLAGLSPRITDSEAFLAELDTYVEQVSDFLGKPSVLESYSSNKIKIVVWQLDSSAKFGTLHLNEIEVKNDLAPIAHQMTHMISTMTKIRWLGEGLAQYLQGEFGKNPPMLTGDAPVDQLAKEFVETRPEMIPVLGTADTMTEISFNVFNDKVEEDGIRYTRAGAFILSYSFSKYLIENYGKEKFLQIYRTNVVFGLEDEYQTIFGKSLDDLRNEWLDYLDTLEPYEHSYKEWYQQIYSAE